MTFDRMIALDFETTGLNPGYRQLEIAWVEFDCNFNVVEQVSSLINPHIPIEPGAQRTHGISAEMLVNEPSLDDFLKKTHAGKFANEHVLVVAHNASYDVPMFLPYCKKITALCTMRLGQTPYPDARNHTLQTLSTLLNVDIEPTHRALDDLGEALREGRALRPARGYRIRFAQDDLKITGWAMDRIGPPITGSTWTG